MRRSRPEVIDILVDALEGLWLVYAELYPAGEGPPSLQKASRALQIGYKEQQQRRQEESAAAPHSEGKE